MKKVKIKQTALCAIFVAIIAASAWICIPTPFGVSFTLQLFAVCLAGLLLGVKGALAATAVYIALGGIGLPIFSHFSGGIGVLFGSTGGFIWGFLVVALLAGIKGYKTKIIKILMVIISVLICHAIGVIQFYLVTGTTVWAAFLSASLPFLAKDIALVFVADFVAERIKL